MADKKKINDVNRMKLGVSGYSTSLNIYLNLRFQGKMADTIFRLKIQ